MVKKGLRGFLSACWERYWLVLAGSLNGAARYGKEGFAWVFQRAGEGIGLCWLVL